MLYFIDGQVFFRIWTFYIVFDDLFWADWVLVYKYMKIKGLDLREISSLPKNENVMNNNCSSHFRASFQPSPKKPHLKTHLHTMKVYITQPVWGIRTAIKSKNDHAYKIAYLKCKRKPEMWNCWIVEPAM